MDKIIVVSGFSKLTPDKLVAKSGTIISNMTNNANFANPMPSLANIQAKRDDLEKTIKERNALEDKLRATNENIKQKTALLSEDLDNLGSYVEITAREAKNPSLVNEAGYALRAPSKRIRRIEVPTGVELREVLKTSGVLQVTFNSIEKARNYDIVYTYDISDNASWLAEPITVSNTRDNIIPLEKGRTVWVKVRSNGPNNTQSDWSDVATRIVP